MMTELMLGDTAKAHDLRYFNVAGADPAGRTGQSTRGATHLVRSPARPRPAVAMASTFSEWIIRRAMAPAFATSFM